MAILTTREVKGVGFAIPRPDGPEKVTGQTRYVADLNPPGLLHAKLLRSPHAHARIKRIDTSKAKALPGVRAILTAADIPELEPGAKTRGHAIMAIDRAVFAGQPVAAVAADELAIADEATEADTSEALAHSGIAPTESETSNTSPNVAQTTKLGRGDVAAEMAK